MYRILIVDDEHVVKLAVKSMIDWNSGRYSLAGTAADGASALRVIEAGPVDIVIADLKMPRMGGIEMISELMSRSEHPEVIVLSNHGDFELVRSALKLGACDYLLKANVDAESLGKCLAEAERRVDQRRLNERLKVNGPDGSHVGRVESFRADDVALVDWYAAAQRDAAVSPGQTGLRVALLVAVVSPGARCAGDELARILGDIAEQGTRLCVRCGIGLLSERSAAILPLVEPGVEIRIDLIASWIMDQARLYYGIDIGIAYTRLLEGTEECTIEFALCQATATRFFYSSFSGRLLASGPREAPVDDGIEPARERITELVRVRRGFEPEVFEEEFRSFLHSCARQRLPVQVLKDELAHAFVDDLPGDKIQAAQSEEALLLAFGIEPGRRHGKLSVDSVPRVEVLRAIEYIDAHVHERITVSVLADVVRVSESQLCAMFKAQTGKSVITYINDRKMEKALSLLRTGRFLVKEVAAEVGVDDQFYFTRLFKRTFGIRPSDAVPKAGIMDDSPGE